jgi:acetyl esterase
VIDPHATTPYVRPDVAQFLAFLNNLPGPRTHELEPPAARAVYVASKDMTDPPLGELAVHRDLAIPSPAGTIPARLYDAREQRGAGPALVFYHGGGFVIGDLETHGSFCAEMARQLDLPVISVDYRLAPEHPWPAAPDDCEAAARWVATSPAELGRQVTELVLAGDSAGGALTVITTMALRDQPAAVPVIAQFPIYPVVDVSVNYASYEAFGEGFLLTKPSMTWFDGHYKPDLTHWRGSPLTGAHHCLPPTLIITAGLDPLRDQGRAYAAALAQHGVPVTYREAVGTIHGFVTLRKAIPSAQTDVTQALTVLKQIIAEATA